MKSGLDFLFVMIGLCLVPALAAAVIAEILVRIGVL